MKKVLLVILCFIFLLNAQEDWRWLNPLPQGSDLFDVCILPDRSILSAGANGSLLRSTDNGDSWNQLSVTGRKKITTIYSIGNRVILGSDSGVVFLSTNFGLSFQVVSSTFQGPIKLILGSGNSVYFFFENGAMYRSDTLLSSFSQGNSLPFTSVTAGYVGNGLMIIASSEKMYRSTDGGSSWVQTSLGFGNIISTISANNRGTLFAAGINGKIFSSLDAGVNWIATTAQGTSWIRDICFFTAEKGIAVGANNQILITSNSGESWIKQKAAGDIYLTAVHCEPGGTAFLCGERGIIGRSTDFGLNWRLNYTDPNLQLNDLFFTSRTNGWAVGNGGVVLHTSNGGVSWEYVRSGILTNLNAVRFLDSLNGWGIGDQGGIVRTYDGGISWELGALAGTSSTNFYDFSFLRQMARAVGAGSTVYESYNFGREWISAVSLPTVDDLYGYAALDERQGVAVGQNGRMYFIYRYFGGTVYENISLATGEELRGICFFNKHGFAVGQYGIVLKTTDGAHFKKIALLNTSILNTVVFADTMTGFTGGSAGRLFRTSNSGSTWQQIHTGIANTIKKIFIRDGRIWLLGSYSALISADVNMSQPAEIDYLNQTVSASRTAVYPQPAKSGSLVTIELPVNSGILEIFSAIGEKVFTLAINENGKVSFTLPQEISSGVYFIVVQSAGSVFTAKMIVK